MICLNLTSGCASPGNIFKLYSLYLLSKSHKTKQISRRISKLPHKGADVHLLKGLISSFYTYSVSPQLLKWNGSETRQTPLFQVFVAFLDLTVHKVQQHSYHFERTDQQKHRINLFSHNLRTKNKGLCTVREISTKTTVPLFSTMMFAGFPNQSPLVTIVSHRKEFSFREKRPEIAKSSFLGSINSKLSVPSHCTNRPIPIY